MMNSTLVRNKPSCHNFTLHTNITPKTPSFRTISIPFDHRNHAVKSQKQSSSAEVVVKEAVKKENDIGRSMMITGVASVGFLIIMMGVGHDKALAFGPEGPLMEEFWENVRRYGLYALTVSTGVLYSVFQPIYELLKNPISAILVLVILGGTYYIGSQVLSAMVGLSDFDYQLDFIFNVGGATLLPQI